MSLKWILYIGCEKHPSSNLIKFLYKSSAFIFDYNSFYQIATARMN